MKTSVGFTLIELILAIVIVVILTTIGVASFNSANRANNILQQAQEIKSLARKLRTDATAAVKPSTCPSTPSTPSTDSSVYGTYMIFVSGAISINYGTSCWSPTSVPAGSEVNYSPPDSIKSLPTGINISSATFTVLYDFNGNVFFFPFSSSVSLTRAVILAATPAATTSKVVITDGTSSRDYQIDFSPTGLVCEEKSGAINCAQ